MAAVVLPTSPAPSAIAWQLVDFGNAQRSVLGGAMQRVNRLGNRWLLNVTLPPMTAAHAREWSAALVAGLENGVRYTAQQPDFDVGTPGALLVKGAGQAGNTLLCDGATPGYPASVGQFISILTGTTFHCYMISAAATADGSGNITLQIVPRLRIQPLNNDVVNLAAPQIEGLLTEAPAWAYDVDLISRGFSFSIEESR